MSQPELWRPAMLAALIVALTASAGAAQNNNAGAAQNNNQGFINPAGNAYAAATPDDPGVAPKIVERWPAEIDDDALAEALNADLSPPPAKPLRRAPPPAAASWNKVSNGDGSATYSVNRPLATPWATKVGADLSTAAPPPEAYLPRGLPGTAASNAGSGSAWANVVVPSIASVELRAEPGNDKFATRLERSIPVGELFSVTAQSSFGVTDLRPLAGPGDAVRFYDTDSSLQLNILPTGTTLAAGTSTASGDPVTHSRLSAAQKIYGPLNVTGSVHDAGQPTRNMSITAGMNFAW